MTHEFDAAQAALDANAAALADLAPRVASAELVVADLAARVAKLETPPPIVWPIIGQDDIQNGALPVPFPGPGAGFDWCQVDHFIGTVLATPSDALGANLSIVPDPLGGNFKCLRHLVDFNSPAGTGTGGGRAQAGYAGGIRAAFDAQAKSAAGVYVAWRMYWPAVYSAKFPDGRPDDGPWLSSGDFHSMDANQANRQHTAPGIFLAKDGSMRFRFEWNATLSAFNPKSLLSDIGLPVGRWFDFEIGPYRMSASKDVTLNCWIDRQLVLTQGGVQTAVASNIPNGHAEVYPAKMYGSNNATIPGSTNWGQIPWTPAIGVRYTTATRFGSGRLT